MYPKLPYLTENGLVAPANLIAIHPSVTITPWQTLSIDFSWDALWRQRREDAFYLGPMRPVKGSEQGSRFIGNQYQVETTGHRAAIFSSRWPMSTSTSATACNSMPG